MASHPSLAHATNDILDLHRVDWCLESGVSDDAWRGICGPAGALAAKGRNVRRRLLVTSTGLQPSGRPDFELIHGGLGPAGFLRALPTVQHPMEAKPVLPSTAEEAYVRQGEDVSALVAWRLHTCMRILAWARELSEHRRRWATALHPQVHAVIGHLHGPLLEKLIGCSMHADEKYFGSLCAGRPALGKIQPAGIYRPLQRSAKISLDDWLRDAPARN